MYSFAIAASRAKAGPILQPRGLEDERAAGFDLLEDARVAVRAARRDANDMMKEAEKDGEITQDERKGGEKKVQDLTDKFVATVDEVAVAKEKRSWSCRLWSGPLPIR